MRARAKTRKSMMADWDSKNGVVTKKPTWAYLASYLWRTGFALFSHCDCSLVKHAFRFYFCCTGA